MTDITPELAATLADSPRALLAVRIMRLARRNEANVPVMYAHFNDTDPNLYVTVGAEWAVAAVKRLAPDAVVDVA